MTPMIDVVFLLLVFFVIGAAGQKPEALLPTDLAPAGGVARESALPEPLPLTIEVWLKLAYDADRRITTVDMNGTLYDDLLLLKQQLRALAEVGPENPIVLDVGPDVPLGDLVEVYDTCQAAGFLSVDFALDGGLQ